MRMCHQIDAFFEGTLAEEDAERFREHFSSCASCRRRFLWLHHFESRSWEQLFRQKVRSGADWLRVVWS